MVERIPLRIEIACAKCGRQGVASISEDDFPYDGLPCRSVAWVSEGFDISDPIRCADCGNTVDEINAARSGKADADEQTSQSPTDNDMEQEAVVELSLMSEGA